MYRNSSNEKTHFYILGVWEYWVTNMQCVVQNITKFIEKLKENQLYSKSTKHWQEQKVMAQ